MNAHTANLLNAIVLIAMSAWAYLSAAAPSMTALIPAAFGLALLACTPGVKSENKIIAHIAAALTLVVVIALFTPLSSVIERGDTAAIIRVVLMLVASVVALVFFVKSFIDARRRRA